MRRWSWLLVFGGCNCNDTREVAATLQGLRWDMACKPDHPSICTAAVPKPTRTATLGGKPDQQYDVTLHFRGVVEQEAYAGGKAEQLWYIGGRPANGYYNIYQLDISAPAQTFFLNAGEANITHVFPLDYQKTIRMQGGATVTLTADAQDDRLIANVDEHDKPVVMPGVPPDPKPFDGQFIQMDVVSVAKVTGTP
jgi:hypothetical protein